MLMLHYTRVLVVGIAEQSPFAGGPLKHSSGRGRSKLLSFFPVIMMERMTGPEECTPAMEREVKRAVLPLVLLLLARLEKGNLRRSRVPSQAALLAVGHRSQVRTQAVSLAVTHHWGLRLSQVRTQAASLAAAVSPAVTHH
jgi:hypothetical protein